MITLDNLTIHQGSFTLANLSMTIPTGEYGVLMGATGCGKTTLIEAICGLRRVATGRILLNDVDVTRSAASLRQIGYVPQEAVLFPTMRVFEQIEFGLMVRRINKESRVERVKQLLDLLEIGSLSNRFESGLSGGEKQRVSLARALAFKPRLLCLDEPLASLDGKTRGRMIELLKKVYQEESVTILHITHSDTEADELGTQKIRLENGRLC